MNSGLVQAAGPALAAVLAAIHAGAFPPGLRWSAEAIGAQIGVPGVFALRLGEVGMLIVRVAADEAEILTLGVVASEQRKGVGAALLRAAMNCAAARGARAMFLEVAEGNEAARRLYSRAGFAAVGRRAAYYPDGACALVLRAELTHPAAAERR